MGRRKRTPCNVRYGLRSSVIVIALSVFLRPEPLGAEEPAKPLDPVVEKIIDSPLSDEDYADAVFCVDGRMLDTVEIIDASRLLFHGRRGRVWLNQLRQPCFGLAPGRTLQFKLQGSRYCNLDSFRAVDTTGAMRGQVTGLCVLNTFEPVSEMQAGLIRESTDRYRRAGVRPKEDATNAERAADAEEKGAEPAGSGGDADGKP